MALSSGYHDNGLTYHFILFLAYFCIIFEKYSNQNLETLQIEIDNISKTYGRNHFAVKDFSITIKQGVLGLLGPNGAGKSTLLRMIATATKPTKGSLTFNDTDLIKAPNYIRKQLGYLPQDFGVYPNLNAIEFLSYMAALKGMGGKGLKDKIYSLLSGLNLLAVAKKPIGNYSGGMKQRIGIAQALLNDPKVLLLDEPTVGLDPEERVRFRNLITELAQNTIVILSSHIVSDIDTIADQVAIMKKGQLVITDNIANIIDHLENTVFEISIPKSAVAQFGQDNIIVSQKRDGENLLLRYINSTRPGSEPMKPTLEDAFLFMTKTELNV